MHSLYLPVLFFLSATLKAGRSREGLGSRLQWHIPTCDTTLTHTHIHTHTHTHILSVSKQSQQLFIPHEFAYLNKSVLEESYGYSPPDTHNHFVLKKRPQASVQLRNEMLQRGTCMYLWYTFSLSPPSPPPPPSLSLTHSLCLCFSLNFCGS